MLLPTILPRPLRFLLLMGLGLGLSGCLFNERGLNSPFVVAREGLTPIQEEPVVLVATTRT